MTSKRQKLTKTVCMICFESKPIYKYGVCGPCFERWQRKAAEPPHEKVTIYKARYQAPIIYESVRLDIVRRMMDQATRSTGRCRVCGKANTLYSEVCEECFAKWVQSSAASTIRWRGR